MSRFDPHFVACTTAEYLFSGVRLLAALLFVMEGIFYVVSRIPRSKQVASINPLALFPSHVHRNRCSEWEHNCGSQQSGSSSTYSALKRAQLLQSAVEIEIEQHMQSRHKQKHVFEAHAELCDVLLDFGSASSAVGDFFLFLIFLGRVWVARGELRRLEDVPMACLTFV